MGDILFSLIILLGWNQPQRAEPQVHILSPVHRTLPPIHLHCGEGSGCGSWFEVFGWLIDWLSSGFGFFSHTF